MKNYKFMKKLLVLALVLIASSPQVWASHGFFSDNACGVKVNYSGSTIDEIKKNSSGASTEALGTISKLYLKEWWFAAWENTNDFSGSESGTMYYRIYPSGSASGSYTSSSRNYYNWGGWSGGSQNVWLGNDNLNVNLYSGKDPGNYIMEYYFMMGSSYLSNGGNNYKISFTVPGFTTTSKSHTFANTTVSSTKDETISFTQHYGTALTTSDCALTGTNADEFEVRSITETGVTVRFKPSTAGSSKSATLTITDAHSKTCTITISGTTQYTVTYNKGDYGTGSNVTANKVYGTDLTLRNSGDFSRTGYNHTAWNTNSAGTGGTSYSLGGSYKSEAAVTLYPTWTAKTTTITLDLNGGDAGDESVTATYDSALPSFTLATKDGGYNLTGYWTETSGGTKVINADGTFAANSGIWNRLDGASLTLHAQWNNFLSVTYDGNGNTGGSAPTDATEYSSGDEVTVASTPVGFVKTGYTLIGWKTGGVTYTAGQTFTITANTMLVAQWSENLTTVTVGINTSGAGTLTVDAAAFTPGNTTTAGVTTSHTVVATAQPGYKFSSWSATGNATGTSSTNTYTLKGNGSGSTGALTANFDRLYAYVEGRFQVKDAARSTNTTTYASDKNWDESSTNIQMGYDDTNHRFVLHTHSTPSELSAQLKNYNPYFYIKTSTSNSSLANTSTYWSSSSVTLSSTGYANGKAVGSSGSNANLRFNSETTSGYAVVYFDQSKIWYELEYRLQYNANGGSGTAPTGANGNNSYHATSTTAATNTFTARTYYTFGGWNTAQYITGTNYAAGASVPMTANTTLYAKWTRSVTLNQEDATTTGSTSVTGTYNCATLPAITNPEKTGYEFGGWYTETAGNGNLIINTSGQLQASKYHWTDASGRFDRTTEKSAADLYAKWTQTVTLNANTGNHGSGDNTTATIVYKATAKTSITHCTPAAGYNLVGYYTAATDGTKILEANGDFAGSNITVSGDAYISGGAWVHAGATTLYAHYEPNTYDVTLKANTGTGDNQIVEATYDDDMPTTLKGGGAITVHTKTGYNLLGYWDDASSGNQYYSYNVGTSTLSSYRTWNKTSNTNLFAHWSAKGYTVTLDIDEVNHGTIDGKDTEASVTYDAAPTAIVAAKLPTAAQGYALYGYYTDHNGEGIKLINADGTWIASVDGYTDANKKWVHDGDVTLYAYYKIGTITDLTFSPAAVIAPSTSITATPTFDPTPTGTYKVCWEVQYSNGTPLPSQPTFIPGASNAVSFSAPAASATYRLQATLKTGNDCASGTELCVYSTTFQVAGEHTVTVRYQDESGRTIKDTIHITARPLEWTTAGDITPPTITGYKFDHWNAGDGVTIKNGASTTTTTTTSSIQIKATYDGTLTAVYAKKKLIFFNNTLGWSDVYVYFYNSDKYWNDAFGSGAKQTQAFDGDKKPYWEQEHGHMTQIEGTNIWYFDYEAKNYSTRANVVFTEGNQHGYQWFNYTKAARRGDHISDLQMFVPLTTKTHDLNNTQYYNSGYWMNYPENTGYSLLIYNQKAKAGATKLYEFPFEFTGDFTMPMELVVDLEAGQTYGFEIKRADGSYYSNTGTITANATNQTISKDQSSYFGLQTTVAGNYTFSLYYSSSNYKMDVTYPVAVNDYRIVYTDLATWSKDAHTASWYHPSRVITKNSSATEVKKDTVSFFWSYGSSPAIKYQTCSAVSAGSASWSAGTAISVSSYSSVLTKKGVYNFIFEQPAGGASISLVKVEPYTGKYYIRTDCAGSSKWVNYRSTDHEMTYSEYTETNHGYSHYFPHWVTTGQNVKFVIANDYSPCISDTLVEDKGTTIADITTEGNANAGRLNSGNASIRFMWKQADNKVSRAYISGSTNVSDRFLVLEGDSKMYDENGNPLSITGLNANEINLVDDQNFVYERTIQVNTGAKAKLTAKYNNKVQYFRGGSGSTAADSVELLGGNAEGKHTMRIVYDFKTNRLVTAYVPSGTIEDDIAIHADLMIVREHQEAGQQLLFNGGSLSEVETVYGVMRFNRWTLNNKEKTGGHSVVGDPKSPYERALYWISFPFNVNLSDVFGFGTYGTHWIIMEYDGAERAKKGYWKDSDGFWKYVTNRTGKVLESGKGYVLGLDLDLMKDNNETFWAHNIEQVELFFPSASYVSDISATNVTTSAEEHLYDAAAHPGHTDDRTYKDSHWNMIGVPSYANYGTTLTSDGSTTVNWATPTNADLPYLYEWNMVDNTYTVQTGTTYPFQSMHAYMVQYHGNLYWSMASATPPVSPIVARRTYAEKPQNVEFRLALSQNDMMIDQTFVKLSNDENVSANFVFDEDLSKEYNANKANIYTVIEGNTPAAGNTMPMSEQTTVIPVGVKIATNGEYTFAMPDGTSGIGVTLIDNETGIRSNLALEDYIVNLEAATYENRFYLEISPIKNTPTDIENTDAMNSNVRKVMVDGLLYIIKDGKVFDAHGARVK